jgi:hypothetical protein
MAFSNAYAGYHSVRNKQSYDERWDDPPKAMAGDL